MAKFCTKCGRELSEGEVCNCTQTVTTTSNVSNTPVDVKENFMDCVNVFKKIFTKPFEAIKEFVCENKYVAGIIMTVVAALSTGIYKIATLKNMYSANSSIDSFTASDFSDMLSNVLSGGSIGSREPEYLKEFMTTFATNLVEYALIIAIGYFIVSKLLKGTASFKQMITAVGISLSIVFAANIINSILVFIDGELIANIRVYISSFATILSTLILYGSVKQVSGVDENKLFVSIASMSVFATIVMDIIQKLFK